MSQLIYNGGGYALSTLRSYLTCGVVGGFTTASGIKSAFAGQGSTGSMAFAMDSWINTRCWRLTVYSGSGTVAVTSPWASGYSSNHPVPMAGAVTSNNNTWVTIDASPSSNYSFAYWYRQEPSEVWSYSANTSYYVPTGGWEATTYVGAAFDYSPPPPPPSNCYFYEMNGYYYGAQCGGFGQYGFLSGNYCMQYVDYGGFQSGASCGGECVVKGTSIEMADGTHKLIEKIRVGDVLKGMKISDAPEDDTIVGWSTDTLNLIETEVKVVGILPFASQRIHNFNNGLIETSESHAHFIKRGNDWFFEQARNIQVGDFLVDKTGNSIEITSIDVLQGDERKIVYSMDVENTDTYIANGLITHNPAEKIEGFE
jgi:hypothetical protein